MTQGPTTAGDAPAPASTAPGATDGLVGRLRGWRAALLWWEDAGRPRHTRDGLLVTGLDADGVWRVRAIGDWPGAAELQARWPGLQVTDHSGCLIAPGFVDLHVHYPQTDVIASAAEGLLPWLQRHTFPHEARFADAGHARAVAEFFFDELARHGVTTALAFATSHPASVDAAFDVARTRGLRFITGKCLQDRHCPDGVRDQTEQSLIDTEALIGRWHGVQRLGYAITPRFAPACSDAQLRGAGELAAAHPQVWIQSHVAENRDELRWVAQLYPDARSYLAVYERFGLLRERAVYAHCIWLDAQDRALLAARGAAAAICPTSNLFLGSGFFDWQAADAAGMRCGLASDVGGGTSFSPFCTMRAAYWVGREGLSKPGISLGAARLWWQHTAAAAAALGLGGVVGNLAPGCEADLLVLDPQATPLLARRCAQANSLEEWLFAFLMLADDRAVRTVVPAGTDALSG